MVKFYKQATEKQYAEIERLRAEGWSYQKIGKNAGCNQRTVQRVLSRGGPKKRAPRINSGVVQSFLTHVRKKRGQHKRRGNLALKSCYASWPDKGKISFVQIRRRTKKSLKKLWTSSKVPMNSNIHGLT